MNLFKFSSRLSFLSQLPRRHFCQARTDTERVNLAWDKIEKWYSLNAPKTSDWALSKGASAASIEALEKHINIPLPEAFKASLARRNGTKESKWSYGALLTVDEVKSEYSNMKKQLDAGAFRCRHRDITGGKVKAIHWSAGWIPMVVDLAGCFTYIDMDPGVKGEKGQIIFADEEFGTEVNNKSYVEYLETIAEKFEKGRYTIKGDWMYEKDIVEDAMEAEIVARNINKIISKGE